MTLPAAPGRPPKLKVAQQRGLPRVPLKGLLAHGYNTNVWTTARIAEAITREFGVSYHRDHARRLMHSLNRSHQKPEKRAVERDAVASCQRGARAWNSAANCRADDGLRVASRASARRKNASQVSGAAGMRTRGGIMESTWKGWRLEASLKGYAPVSIS